MVMGLENRIVYNLVDVVEGNCRMKQALIKDKKYPEYIPASVCAGKRQDSGYAGADAETDR